MYHFRDTASYLLKVANLSYAHIYVSPHWGDPVAIFERQTFGIRKLES